MDVKLLALLADNKIAEWYPACFSWTKKKCLITHFKRDIRDSIASISLTNIMIHIKREIQQNGSFMVYFVQVDLYHRAVAFTYKGKIKKK